MDPPSGTAAPTPRPPGLHPLWSAFVFIILWQLAASVGATIPVAVWMVGHLDEVLAALKDATPQKAFTQLLAANGTLLMAASAVAAGPTFGTVVLCRRVIDKKTIAELGLAWRPTQLAAGFVASGLMVLAISGGLWASGALRLNGLATAAESGALVGAKLLGLLFLVFLQSGAEELVCRGYLLRTLMGVWRPWVSVAVVSLFFAALHLMNAGTTLASFASTALIGVLFAQVCLHTGTLWVAIGLHTAWNFTLGAIASLPVSGSTTFHLLAVEDLGPAWLTGGSYGPEASVVTICLVAVACSVMAIVGRGRTRLAGD